MKEQKPIARQAAIPKRGTQFYWTEGKIDVWLEKVVSAEEYFVYDTPERRLTDKSFLLNPGELLQHKKGGYGIVSRPKKMTEAEKKTKDDLNVFFASQLLIMPFLCENCNKPLYAFTSFEKRCTIAHILPKEKEYGFPSVATHPQNRMFLCAKGGCHNSWDKKDAKERAKMPCYQLALERFRIFKSEIPQAKLQTAYKQLNINQGIFEHWGKYKIQLIKENHLQINAEWDDVRQLFLYQAFEFTLEEVRVLEPITPNEQ